jgi:ATP-binding cassette subfamily B protein
MTKIIKKLSHVYSFVFSLAPFYFCISILSGLVSSLFPYISIYFSAKIIDSIIATNPVQTTLIYVYWLISLNMIVGTLKAGLADYRLAYQSKLQRELSEKITRKSMSLSYEDIENQETLRLIAAAKEGSNGSGDLSDFVDALANAIEAFSNLVYAIVLLSGLFVASSPTTIDAWSSFLMVPYSALIVFAPILLTLICSFPIVSKINSLSYKAMMENVEGNRHFSYFYNLCYDYQMGKDIRLYHMAPMIKKAQGDAKNTVNSIWEKFSIKFSFLQMIISFLYAIINFVAYAYLGLKAIYGLISVGTAVSLVATLVIFSNSISSLVQAIMQQSLSANYLQNYFLYLSLPSKLTYGKNIIDFSKPLSIEFSHVSFHYPNSKELSLDDVSYSIKPNEKLAIVGLNGAGKTTMMKLLCRFYEPTKGEILINGLPLNSYDKESSYRLYSIVFQDFKLFSYSIKENVAAGEEANEDKVIDCLKKVGVYSRVNSFNGGINTVIYNKNDDNGVEISGGEAQKIAFARALYKDSPLIILDEPTSALDPKSEADIYESLRDVTKGKTSVFISHRMSSTKFCDDIIVIDKGKIVEEGNHTSLLKIKDGLYKKMWDAQAQYYQ